MINIIKSKLRLKANSANVEAYNKCISDLAETGILHSMEKFVQHSNISCLEHSIYVSYVSFRICRRLGLDYRSAARGALLHDFFLYDWHIKGTRRGLHGFTHPHAALTNANKHFQLNKLEKDIIAKHMWPLTISLPKYKESFIVVLADKYCATMEIIKFGGISRYLLKRFSQFTIHNS
ncbi:MAG: HD domain-containing protein [Clostridia bacterium]